MIIYVLILTLSLVTGKGVAPVNDKGESPAPVPQMVICRNETDASFELYRAVMTKKENYKLDAKLVKVDLEKKKFEELKIPVIGFDGKPAFKEDGNKGLQSTRGKK